MGIYVPATNPNFLAVRSTTECIAWPAYIAGPAASLLTLMHEFEASQWFPELELRTRQLGQLSALVAYAYEHSPYFRRRMDQQGLSPKALASMDDVRLLPVLTRTDIQQAGDELHCKEVPRTHLPLNEGKSSGSTGEPVTVKKTAVTSLFWQANMMREHFWHGRDMREKLLVIRSGIKEPMQQPGWGNPADLLFKTGVVMGMPVVYDIKEHIRAIEEFQPQHLNIYPSTLEGLITYCEKNAITLPPIKHIWCISETVTPELRRRATAFFKASVEDDYSSNELGVIALQCPLSGYYHEMSESVLMEVVDEEGRPCREGEIGRVLVTSINNFATPLIRYEIGDYAEMGGACSCGRGMPIIRSIKGRKRNLVIKPDGTRHWPTLTVAIFHSELPIHQFQLIQHSLKDVEVRLYAERPLTAEEEGKLTGKMHIALGHPFPLRFVYFDDRLPLPPNGKFEDFICRVNV